MALHFCITLKNYVVYTKIFTNGIYNVWSLLQKNLGKKWIKVYMKDNDPKVKITEARWQVKGIHYTLLFSFVHTWNFKKILSLLMKILITCGLCAALINTYMNTQIIIILLHTTTSCRLFGRLTVEMPWNGRWEKSIFCKGPPTLWLRVKDTFRFEKLLGAGEIFIVWTSPLALFISSL